MARLIERVLENLQIPVSLTDESQKRLIGVSLFVLFSHYIPRVVAKSNKVEIDFKNSENDVTLSDQIVSDYIAGMESLVQRDEGNRGIAELCLPRGELQSAAEILLRADHVTIITGFPCMIEQTPPTETDGPLGAFAIARALLHMGKRVLILTDECNEDVLLACLAGSGLIQFQEESLLSLESLPATQTKAQTHIDDDGDYSIRRIEQIRSITDLIVAIERAGPNEKGKYLIKVGI